MITVQNNVKLVPHWLFLAVSAIAIAGLYSIILVLLRTPIFYELIPYKNFFKSALIVHVDLSVLVWFFAIQSALISQYINNLYISKLVLGLAILGALILAGSPLQTSIPFMNNYVPILQNFSFAFSVGLFTSAVLIYNVYFIGANVLSLNKYFIDQKFLYSCTSSIIVLAAIICIYIAKYKLQAIDYLVDFGIQDFFERLFWGGGHILQFAYMQLMQFAWIVLYQKVTDSIFKQNKILLVIALINPIVALPMIIIMNNMAIDSADYIIAFTDHMRYFAGIAPTLLASYLLFRLIRTGKAKIYDFEFSALISSMTLFFVGGLISLFIKESNTIIPAHYHGSIVGVTVALMGLLYVNLVELNFKFNKNKLMVLIPYLYCLGQFAHIMGLAISGGYGALRKTPGEVLSSKAMTALGLMGAGGLIALMGGLLFVYICYNAFFHKWCQKKRVINE
jgi:hypothetical protein